MTAKWILTALTFLSSFAWAGTTYYLGEETITNAAGKELGRNPLLVEKVTEPEKGLITETAIEVKGPDCVQKYSSYLTVEGNKFSLKDSTGTVTGKGEFSGEPWAWTYFKATFESTLGFQIEDENFMSDPHVLVARKKITRTITGELLFYMDATVKEISASLFKGLSAPLLKAGTAACRH